MERGGFLDTRKTNPVTLGLIVAAHGVVLTALALAPPEAIQRIIFVPLIVKSIPKTTPPPDTPLPQPKIKQAHRVDIPTTVIPEISTTHTPPVIFNPPPPLPDTDTTATVIPPRLPVFLPAAIDPAAAGRIQPEYPPSLARAEIEGVVTVRVLIGADGHVKQVDMVSATDPAFFEATRKQALRYWRFRPATNDGVAAESWRTMTVRFRLQS